MTLMCICIIYSLYDEYDTLSNSVIQILFALKKKVLYSLIIKEKKSTINIITVYKPKSITIVLENNSTL